MQTTYYNFGVLDTGVSSTTANSLVITNNGNIFETYGFCCKDSLNWKIGSNIDNDTFVLRAAFHPVKPEIDDFNIRNNIISKTNTLCSDMNYTIDGTQTGSYVDPFNNSDRNLWFKFSTPLATSTSSYQDVLITITAEESP